MKRRTPSLKLRCVFFAMCLLVGWPTQAAPRVKIAVFNFSPKNLEASAYGSTITNLLTNQLENHECVTILDRKELESFLSLNDLQQSDDLENIFTIGSRLGLDFIVAGHVTKRGPAIVVDCKTVKIDGKEAILHTRLKFLGASAIDGETKTLAKLIETAIADAMTQRKRAQLHGGDVARVPQNIVTRAGKSKISLSWECPAGFSAAGYRLYRGTSESGPFVRIAQIPDTQYSDNGLEDNKTYFYKIKAYDANGREGDCSATVSATTQIMPTPEAPIILSVEEHVKSLRVIWSPNPLEDPHSVRTKGYRLCRAEKPDGPYHPVGEIPCDQGDLRRRAGSGIVTFDFTDSGLDDGMVFHYKVTACSEENLEGDFSRPMHGRVIPPVEGIQAQGNLIREIRLAWRATPGEHVAGYRIYRSRSEKDGFTSLAAVHGKEATTFVDQNSLEDNATYFYRLTAFDESGRETSASQTVSARTRGAPPGPADLVALSGLVKKVRLQWAARNQEDVEGYKLYRALSQSGPYEQISTVDRRTTAAYEDGGTFIQPLKDETTYHYRLTTFNRVGVESETWAYASAVTKPRPKKPEGLKAWGNQAAKISLEWEPNPEKDIVHYLVYRKAAGEGHFSHIAKTGERTSFIDEGLKAGSGYSYMLKAEDRDGLLSEFSENVTAVTKPRPRPPTGLKGRYEGGRIILTWKPNSEPDVSHYNILEESFFGFKRIASANAAECRLTNIAPGKNKTYAVTAVDGDDLESVASRPVTVTSR